MSRRTLLALLVAAALALFAVPASQAAPPATGESRPSLVAPQRVADGYVGAVMIGPRSYCGNVGTGSLSAAAMCVDVRASSCRTWKRDGARAWKAGRMVTNSGEQVYFTAGYADGYQWIWSLRSGFSVVATKCLVRYEAVLQ